MAFNKRTWKGRQGTGLNKFSIDGATPVTVVNQPDSVTEQGDALSAGNLNDLEDRIDNAFEEIADGTQVVGKATADASGNVIDQTYETKAEASDLKDAIQANSHRISNLEEKADPTGAYKTVNYRGTNEVPTGKAKYALVESIVGKSRAWNQQMPALASGNGYRQYNYSTTITYLDGVASISSSGTSCDITNLTYGQIITGKKYLFVVDVYSANGSIICKTTNGSQTILSTTVTANTWVTLSALFTATTDSYIDITTGSGSQIRRWMLRELNLIFPEGVPSTVAECVQKCPDILKYDSYGSSIVDTTVGGVKSIGFNRYDEQWENGLLNLTTGQPEPNSSYSRSKNFCGCDPSETYYLHNTMSNVTQIIILWYDINKNYINYTLVQTNPIIPLPNAYYFKFRFNAGSVVGTLCFNVSQPNTSISPHDGQYLHYMTDTLYLPSSVTLRSAGPVQDELDVESGVVTRKLSVPLDLSTLTWAESSLTAGSYYAQLPIDAKVTPNSLSTSTIESYGITSHYKEVSIYDIMYGNPLPDKAFALCNLNGTGVGYQRVYLRDSSVDSSDYASSFADHYLVYELNAQTTEASIGATVDNLIYTESGGTIETMQTQSPVIDNCLDVGYLAL